MSPDATQTKSAIWDALAWLWNAFITSIISGAGFYFIAVVVEYLKQYSREQRERRAEYEDLDGSRHDEILSSNPRSRAASIFSSYKASAAFLAATAFPRNRYQRPHGSSILYRRQSPLHRHLEGYYNEFLVNDSSSSSSNEDRGDLSRYFPKEEGSDGNMLALIHNQALEFKQHNPLNTSPATLLETRIKRKHGIQQWSDIDPSSISRVNRLDDSPPEARSHGSPLSIASHALKRPQGKLGGKVCNPVINHANILKYLSGRDQQFTFQKSLLKDMALTRPFIVPFLSETVIDPRSWSNEAIASSSVNVENAMIPLMHPASGQSPPVDNQFVSNQSEGDQLGTTGQSVKPRVVKKGFSKLIRKRKIKSQTTPETKSKKMTRNVKGDSKSPPRNVETEPIVPSGSSLMCKELEMLLDDHFPLEQKSGGNNLSPWIETEKFLSKKHGEDKKKTHPFLGKRKNSQSPTVKSSQNTGASSPPKLPIMTNGGSVASVDSLKKNFKPSSGQVTQWSPVTIQQSGETDKLLRSCSFGKMRQGPYGSCSNDIATVRGDDISPQDSPGRYASPTKRQTIKSKIHPMLDGLVSSETNQPGLDENSFSPLKGECENTKDEEVFGFEDLELELDSECVYLDDVIKKQEELLMSMQKRKSFSVTPRKNGKPRFITTNSREASWNKTVSRLRSARIAKQRAAEEEKQAPSYRKNSSDSLVKTKTESSQNLKVKGQNKRPGSKKVDAGSESISPKSNISALSAPNERYIFSGKDEKEKKLKKEKPGFGVPKPSDYKDKSRRQAANLEIKSKTSDHTKSGKLTKSKSHISKIATKSKINCSNPKQVDNPDFTTDNQDPTNQEIRTQTTKDSKTPKERTRSKTPSDAPSSKHEIKPKARSSTQKSLKGEEIAVNNPSGSPSVEFNYASKKDRALSNPPIRKNKSNVTLPRDRSMDNVESKAARDKQSSVPKQEPKPRTFRARPVPKSSSTRSKSHHDVKLKTNEGQSEIKLEVPKKSVSNIDRDKSKSSKDTTTPNPSAITLTVTRRSISNREIHDSKPPKGNASRSRSREQNIKDVESISPCRRTILKRIIPMSAQKRSYGDNDYLTAPVINSEHSSPKRMSPKVPRRQFSNLTQIITSPSRQLASSDVTSEYSSEEPKSGCFPQSPTKPEGDLTFSVVAPEYRSAANAFPLSNEPSRESLTNASDLTESIEVEKQAPQTKTKVKTETSFILKKSVLDQVVQQLQLQPKAT